MNFEIRKSSLGAGYEVVLDGKAAWFKQALSPLQAAILGIQYISSNGGPPASELVKALRDEPLRKAIVEFVTESMKKVEAGPDQGPPVTRKEAMVHLESLIRKTGGDARPIDPRSKAPPSPGEMYTIISLMQTESEFLQHRAYQQIAAEVRAARGR